MNTLFAHCKFVIFFGFALNDLFYPLISLGWSSLSLQPFRVQALKLPIATWSYLNYRKLEDELNPKSILFYFALHHIDTSELSGTNL